MLRARTSSLVAAPTNSARIIGAVFWAAADPAAAEISRSLPGAGVCGTGDGAGNMVALLGASVSTSGADRSGAAGGGAVGPGVGCCGVAICVASPIHH